MDFISRDDAAARIGTAWQENATYFGTIPLYPSGEQTLYEFVNGATSLEDRSSRFRVVFIQVSMACVLLHVFIYNLIISIQMIRIRPNVLPTRLCLIQSVINVACWLYCFGAYTSTGPSCRETLWAISFSMRINDLCTCTVLLRKAHIVCDRNRWFLIFIPLLLAAPVVIIYVSWASPAMLSYESIGCIYIYPSYFPWLRFALHAPIHFTLTLIFIRVAIRHYRHFGTEAWWRLARDGIQVGLLLLLVNIMCALAIAIEFLGVFSLALTLPEW
jgi:hypothetical protein